MDYNLDKLEELSGFKFLLNVDAKGSKLNDWAKSCKESVNFLLEQNGALLIRGLNIYSSKQFGDLLSSLFDSDLLEYIYRSTPRTQLKGNVYTATEYPADEIIPQHNENSYSRNIPRRIGFCCLLPSLTGGETPISDTSLIAEGLTEAEKQKFEQKGIMYVRNYSNMDLPWTEVFQTESKADVEEYCKENELEFEWLAGDSLRTKQINPAFISHPVSGKKLWLNQAHLFHLSNFPLEIQKTLVDSFGERNLPRNTYYGDGSPIEVEVLDKIRAIYEETKIKFQWQKSDLLLLDNFAFTHGRESFTGPRKVLAGLA